MTARIIRVHSAEGVVYARLMEPITFPIDGYAFIEQVAVPTGLTQQGVVNHFRAQGWKVEQDHGDHEWGA